MIKDGGETTRFVWVYLGCEPRAWVMATVPGSCLFCFSRSAYELYEQGTERPADEHSTCQSAGRFSVSRASLAG